MLSPLVGTSVLVVDDDADSAEVLSASLEATGAKVRVAYRGAEALALVRGWTPDVLLLDISMPEMDGHQLLEALRRSPELRARPAIAVTANTRERDRHRAAQSGFSVYVAKPFDLDALVHILERVTNKRDEPPAVRDLQTILETQGLHEALGSLNRRTHYRFTALNRFDGDGVRNLYLFDREDPVAVRGSEICLSEDFCLELKRTRRPLVATEALIASGVRRRSIFNAYCGVLLRHFDGTPFGTLCHFGEDVPPASGDPLAVLLLAAPILAEGLVPKLD